VHFFRRVLVPVSLVLGLGGCVNPPATTTTAQPAPAPTATMAAPSSVASLVTSGPETKLQKGMLAGTVRQIMGEPVRIEHTPALAEGAEVWFYRRVTLGPSQQVLAGSRPVTVTERDPGGELHTRTLSTEQLYRGMHMRITETIQLLMYDGMYLEQKRNIEAEKEWE
jgi:hypothetical protein